MIDQHNLPSTHGKKKKRLGRGDASKGSYSGRGMKGQRSRSGGKGGLKLRGLKQSMMKVPKVRGFNSPHKKAQVVSLKSLEGIFEAGEEITPAVLFAKKLIADATRTVKILGTGKLTKSLTVKVHAASATALEAITAAGGSFEAIFTENAKARTTSTVSKRAANKAKKPAAKKAAAKKVATPKKSDA